MANNVIVYKNSALCKFVTLLSLFIIPFLVALEVIIINNFEKFNTTFKYFVFFVLLFFVFAFVLSFFLLIIRGQIFNSRRIYKKIGLFLVCISYILEIFSVTNLVYYNESFKNFLITSSMFSINHKDIATSLYGSSVIDDVVNKNTDDSILDNDLVNFDDISYESDSYINKYEAEILSREDGALYKIIDISGTVIGSDYKYKGYMAVIYDPSKVKLAKSSGAGVDSNAYGETLAVISQKNNAVIAMNAGGFYDPDWQSNGGIPHGDVIIDGKVDTSYIRGIDSGGIIGFDKDNKLVLKRMTKEEAIGMGIRDAVDWGPYLIVDGINMFKHVNYYTWACARAAIGQRKDGIVLMLVIDGLQEHSKGVSYADVASIMEKYGAINAASLDGGTSTSMTVNHKYINSPFNGYVKTYRYIPNAFIVVE